MPSSTRDTPQARLIPANEQTRTRWANGAGWTREIHAEPLAGPTAANLADGGIRAGSGQPAWRWRLSIAEIAEHAAFSRFPGVERELLLVHGNGLRLCFEDGERLELPPPRGRARFHGERPVTAEPLAGPVHVFNLMWRPAHVHAELLLRPLVGPMLFFVGPGTHWAIHLLAGQAHFDDASGLPPLQAGDTALLASASTRARHVIEGGGELIAVKFADAARA